METRTRRTYDSSRRRETADATRATVIAAATEVFVERGWTGTSMREVARRAGVSVETVYSSVGAKVELLKIALDVGVVGDTDEVPLADRPEFLALAQGNLAQRAQAVGKMMGGFMPRSAPLRRVLHQAAAADPELADLVHDQLAGERESFRMGIEMVAGHPVPASVIDGMRAAISPEAYLTLTQVTGWSDAEFEAWVAEMVLLILRDHDPKE
jgi:AcrR family transcriptional regulator